jgi:glucose 1-dehydrogenase
MRARLEHRTAIVTGGAEGVGRGIAVRLAGEGATVIIADINEKAGEHAVEIIRASGGKASFAACNVLSGDQIAGLVGDCVKHHGAIDILVEHSLRSIFSPPDGR